MPASPRAAGDIRQQLRHRRPLFRFFTSGQWLWDELALMVPADRDPYPVAEEIQKVVTKETETNARLTEQEWNDWAAPAGSSDFGRPRHEHSPVNLSFEILVRYVTRANERQQQRSNCISMLSNCCAEKNIPQPATPLP